jgi:glycosidase
MLDGVFSHTGDDSVYFNKYGNYDGAGAYQSKDSPYYNWYRFDEFPGRYKSWWGFETLPEVNEHNQDWIDFVIENDDSVINTWLDRGAAGFRLDVADELPDDTIEKMRAALKHNGQDHVLLGEVWEDATTKQSYGMPRTYALGRGLDSVMNYPFTNMVVDFLLFNQDAYALKDFLVGQCQNYPKEMYYCLMNLLSSHDVARIRTRLATRADGHGLTREQQACFVVTEEQDSHGAVMQKLAAAIQFSLPGVPCIYYGDESGMNGLMDPFNRRPYTKCGNDITEYYKTLSNIRKNHAALRTGHAAFLTRAEDMLGILRLCVEGQDALGMEAADGVTLTVVNRSKAQRTFVCDLFAERQCLPVGYTQFFRDVELKQAKSLLSDAQWDINEGLVSIDVAPESADIVEILWV